MMPPQRVEQQTPETAVITAKIEDLRKMITIIGRESRFRSGLWAGFVKGMFVGLFVSMLLIGLKFIGS